MDILRLRAHFRVSLIVCLCFLQIGGLLGQNDDDERLHSRIDDLLEKASKTSNRDESTDWAFEALNLAKSINDDGSSVRALLIVAVNARAAHQPQEALRYYLEAQTKAEKIKDKNQLKQLYLGLGSLFTQENLPTSAIDHYKKALEIDPANLSIIEQIGDAYLVDMQYDSAEVYYKNLIAQYQRKGEYRNEVALYQKLIQAYNDTQNSGKALYYYLKVESILEARGTQSEKGLMYNNLGKQFLSIQSYTKALGYFEKARLQCEYADCQGQEIRMMNTGVCLFNLGRTRESTEILVKAIDLLQKQKDHASLAHAEAIMAGIYFNSNDFYNAISHNRKAQYYADLVRDREALAKSFETAASLHYELYEFEDAYAYYKKYLTLTDSLRFEDKLKVQRMSEGQLLLQRSEQEIKTLHTKEAIKDLELREQTSQRIAAEEQNKALALESRQKEEELLKTLASKKLVESEFKVKSLESLRAKQELRLAAQQHFAELKEREISDLKRKEELDRERQATLEAKQQQALLLLQRDKELDELKLKESATFQRYAMAAGSLMFVILGLLAAGYLYSRRANSRLNAQNKAIELQKQEIEVERQKNEALLLNILPQEVAHELMQTGEATPKVFDEVSVLFTDFVSFTKLTENQPPELVLAELNTCFQAFDEICDKYQLEKIKTIGDAYMAVAGVPLADAQNAAHAAHAGLEMLRFLADRAKTKPNVLLKLMRVGIHTGPVVAGVVGKNKFAYDIWGDTVNTAARMEEFGEAGKVNLSQTTAQKLQQGFILHDRGMLKVYNKGEMQMYFIEGVKPTKSL